MESILTTINLDFFYGQFQALKNINLEIPPNKIVALIGPSGCGKSTLLKVFNRMTDLVEGNQVKGQVLYHNQDIFAPEQDITQLRKQIGMVFQQPNPFPLSIRDNLIYGPKVHGETDRTKLEQIVQESLESVMLWERFKDRLHKKATELLPDEQQRLCIARLIAVQPEILLMDEPCSALDPIATLEIEDLMQKLKEQYTIIIVTHNMQQAARCSDLTGFMLLGDLIEYSETPLLFASPQDKRTDDYISGHYG